MQITDDDLEQFRMLYATEFEEELSHEEASEIAGRVADLYALLAETLPSERRPEPTPLVGEADTPR